LKRPCSKVRHARPGETVGYGCAYAVTRSMRIGILAAGYADGALRSGWKNGKAVLHGRPCPVLGRISMDLIAVDVSDVEAAPGDLVQLLGPEALLDDAATAAGTISYELLTRLSNRAERRYLGRAD
jgi:alanine racemase